MTAERTLLVSTLDGLLSAHCTPAVVDAAGGAWDPELWQMLEETGLTSVGLPDDAGAAGGDLHDALAIAKELGRHAAPVPWPETAMLAGWLLLEAGLPWQDRPSTVTPPDSAHVRLDSRGLHGSASAVPWASCVDRVVVLARTDGGLPHVAVINPGDGRLRRGSNLAQEPRDYLYFDSTEPEAVAQIDESVTESLLHRGALARTAQMVGAQGRVLQLTIEYAREREQFGRPIGSFQAVSQQIAILAGEVAAAAAALEGAADALAAGDGSTQIAMAKVRAAASASLVGSIAHQVHGALGFTQEHRLQHFSRRMWAWRDEFGTQGTWEQRIGRELVAAGAASLWPNLTR